MPRDGDKGSFSADIPDDAIAAALAAVEKRAAAAAHPPGKAGVEGATAAPGASPGGEEATGEARPGVPLSEAERLGAELAMSQDRARQVFEQLRGEHDRLLRATADLENYKKRAAREKEEVLRYGNERLLKEILPVVDNLDRALAAAPEGDPLVAGVEMIRRVLLDVLGRYGVKGFSARGQTFDPRFHEALMMVASAEHPPGTVLEEQARGFMLHDRLLRPAAVVVAAAPAAPAAGGGGAPGDAP